MCCALSNVLLTIPESTLSSRHPILTRKSWYNKSIKDITMDCEEMQCTSPKSFSQSPTAGFPWGNQICWPDNWSQYQYNNYYFQHNETPFVSQLLNLLELRKGGNMVCCDNMNIRTNRSSWLLEKLSSDYIVYGIYDMVATQLLVHILKLTTSWKYYGLGSAIFGN